MADLGSFDGQAVQQTPVGAALDEWYRGSGAFRYEEGDRVLVRDGDEIHAGTIARVDSQQALVGLVRERPDGSPTHWTAVYQLADVRPAGLAFELGGGQ